MDSATIIAVFLRLPLVTLDIACYKVEMTKKTHFQRAVAGRMRIYGMLEYWDNLIEKSKHMHITQWNMEQFNPCNYENFQNIGTLHRNFAYMDPCGIMRIIRILRMLGILKCAVDLKVRTVGMM